MKSVIQGLVLATMTALFSLPFLALYVLVFFGIGGGWAYSGPNGCHFVIGPLGYLMLGPPIFTVGSVVWLVFQKIRSTH